MCIPLCASILFVLPAGNHTNAISACVSYIRINNHSPKCAPPAGHHRAVLSVSAPMNTKHCVVHPSAITIAIGACAFQPGHSNHWQSHRCNQCVCVSNIRISNHSSLCVPPAAIRASAFFFYTSERKSFLQSTQSPTSSRSVLVGSMVCIPLCASIVFFLLAGNHTNAISACVSYTGIRSPNCAPPAGHHRVVLSIF